MSIGKFENHNFLDNLIEWDSHMLFSCWSHFETGSDVMASTSRYGDCSVQTPENTCSDVDICYYAAHNVVGGGKVTSFKN